MKTESLKRVDYRLPDDGKTVPAFILCDNGESTLLLVPFFTKEQPDVLVIAHDDDLDGVYEDSEMSWFNVESNDMATIGQNLLTLSRQLR
jgi:hypothetical protein